MAKKKVDKSRENKLYALFDQAQDFSSNLAGFLQEEMVNTITEHGSEMALEIASDSEQGHMGGWTDEILQLCSLSQDSYKIMSELDRMHDKESELNKRIDSE